MSISIFDGIERFSDRIAFIGEDGAQTTYAQLAEQADAFTAQIGETPQLLQTHLLYANLVESQSSRLDFRT
jgi:hypothetical protein